MQAGLRRLYGQGHLHFIIFTWTGGASEGSALEQLVELHTQGESLIPVDLL